MQERIRGYEPAAFIRIMDELGIRRVYIPTFKMWSYLKRAPQLSIDVDEVLPLMEAYPDRIGGLFGIDVSQGMDGVYEMEDAVRRQGFAGAHIHSYGYGLPLNHRDYYPYYAKCSELGVPVIIQTGHSAEKMPSRMGHPMLLDDVALYFPELKLVASHTGWPWVEELIAMAWKHPNVYIGGSGHAPKYWDPAFVQFLDSRRGRGKVLWGTDFPVVYHKDSLEQVEQLGLKPESREALLWGAARKVFNL